MAQSITNTVSNKNPLQGLFSALTPPAPSATAYGGLFAPKPSPLAGLMTQAPNMSTVNGPKYAPPPTIASIAAAPKTAAPVIPQQTPTIAPAPAQQQQVTSGNFTTPSGAVVNPQGGLVSGPANSGATGSGTTATANTATKGLFPDILSSLALGSATNNAALGANAQKIAADAAKAYTDVGRQGASFAAGQRTTGTTPVAEGNAAVTAQTTAAQQQAISQGANVALTGNSQAIGAQGQTQSALSSAAGYAQPQVTSYGQTFFNPVTQEFAGGANGGLPPDVMQQYAQMAASGQYAAIPSFITSNPVLNAQLNSAAKAINPAFNPVQANAASGVLATIPALTSASAAAEGIKNTISNYLSANPTVNASTLAQGNILNQWIAGQISDPRYSILLNQLTEYANTLAPILGVGGDPTNMKTQIAQSFVNAAASGQSINQVLGAMSTLADNKIKDLQSGATGGGTTVPYNPISSGGVWDF